MDQASQKSSIAANGLFKRAVLFGGLSGSFGFSGLSGSTK
jgi:hypothetical protein